MSVASERGSSKGAATRGRSSGSAGSRSSGSAGSRSSGSAGSRSQGASRRASSRTTSRKSSQNGRSGRSTASSRSSSARSNAENGNGASTSRAQSSGNRSQASGKRSQTSGNRASQRSQGSENGTRETVTNVAVPILTATLGVAGGVLLSRTKLQRNRKVLGIPVPNTKIDLSGLTQQIGEAGRQFGKLAGEVRTVREKAEQIGRAVS